MIEKNVLVSIIIPIYGTEEYLCACIDSICNQSYKNIQIILVDDQSPDRCPQICDEYAKKDNRIKVIHQENKGVSAARNAGLDCANGKYIIFVDSDDELYPEAVEILLKDAFEYDADIVSTGFGLASEKVEINKNDKENCKIFKDIIPLLFSLEGDDCAGSACSKLFKFDFVKDLRFEEGKNIGEDIFYVFECYSKKPTLVVHEVPIYRQNIRQGSSSRQEFTDKYLAVLYFLNKKKELVAKYYPEFLDQVKNMEVRANLQMLDLLCRTTDKKYRSLQKQCIKTVRKLYDYHKPIRNHYKKLAWIVKYGFYPIYKIAVRIKYYR